MNDTMGYANVTTAAAKAPSARPSRSCTSRQFKHEGAKAREHMDLTTLDGRSYLHLDHLQTVGLGKVQPRIQVTLKARTTQAGEVARGQLIASLSLNYEQLGTSPLTFIGPISASDTYVPFDIAVSRHALQYLQEQMQGSSLPLSLGLSGLMWVQSAAPPDASQLRNPVGFDDGAPVPVDLARITSGGMMISLARSHVYTQILEPTGFGRYVLMEMPIPTIPDPARWQTVMEHLQKADEQWTLGHDADVFSHCHAALESATFAAGERDHGNLLARVEDDYKRGAVDALVQKAKKFLDSGRHVSKQAGSEQQGKFAVDHQDAEFARAQTRFLVAYLAKLLTDRKNE